MSVRIQFFGVAGYMIVTSNGTHVLIDPFLDENPYSPVKSNEIEKVDLMLITHNAFDHFGDAPKIIKKHGCRVICAVDVLHHLVQYHGIDPGLILPTIWGMSMETHGVLVHPVESHHWSFTRKQDGALLSGPAMGFVIDAGENIRIYHPGDTALFSDMKLLGQYYKPNVGFVHVTLPEGEGVSLPNHECYRSGELTPRQALVASEWLGLEHVVVSHYVDPECDDVKEFVKLVDNNRQAGGYTPKLTVLKPGDWLNIEK
ncbi:MAG: MBL fold metallo-hydrolase [candidate division Zixibacteria bacterium]|nr:MBL fold metallo-hydrolase [candidate division Zixibacteria bacterium]